MKGKTPLRDAFEMVAGNPALDLVNSLDDRFAESGPKELLGSYDDLLRFVVQAELITERQFRELTRLASRAEAGDTVLAEAIQLRESLAAVAYALLNEVEPPKSGLLNLTAIFNNSAAHRKLTFDESFGAESALELAWEYKNVGRSIQSPVWLLAQAANDLLTSPQACLIRRCASPNCQWLFLDTSKNHTRRWCDMKVCGNRNKARLFQLRQAAV